MTNLSELLKYLLESKLEFVLIGGYAGVVHGSSYVTKDLDICALLSPEHIASLRKILAPLNPKHRMTLQKLSFLTNPSDSESLNNVYLQTDLGVLDVITEVIGVGNFDEVSKRAKEVVLFGYPCKVISIEDLITAKKIMGRDKDKITLRELELIGNKVSS